MLGGLDFHSIATAIRRVLGASFGSELIGFLQLGLGAFVRSVRSKLREHVSITDFLPNGYVTDGTVDYSTHIQAAIDYAAGVFASLGGGGELEVPPGIWGIGAQIIVHEQVQLVGHGRVSEIKAISGTFPINTALIRLGDGNDLAFNTRCDNLTINCNNIAGSIGIYSTDLQEQSGGRDVLVRAYGTNGILIDSAAGQGCDNYFFEDVELLTNTGGAGNVGVWIKGAQSWKAPLRNISIVAPAGTPGDHGVRIGDGAAIVNGILLDQVHVENFANAVKVEANAQNVKISGLDGLDCTDLLEIATTQRVMASGLFRSGGTNTINDTANGVTVTSTAFPLYVCGEIIDVSGITNRGILLQRAQAQLVGTVAAPVLIDKSAASIGTGRFKAFVGDGSGGTAADEAYEALLNTDKHWWGGAAGTTPIADLLGAGTNAGEMRLKAGMRPGTPALAKQTAAAMYAGSGAPNNADGSNGDFYFRSDGTKAGSTVIYHKEAGAWVALTS